MLPVETRGGDARRATREMTAGIDIIAIALLALAPGLAWLWYFARKGTPGPQGPWRPVRLFFAGMLVMPAAVLLEKPAGGSMFFLLVVAAPVIEESLKLAAVRLSLYRQDAPAGPLDGIVSAATAALGFASAENIYTILASYLAPQLALGLSDPAWAFGMIWKLYLVRALLTVPGHALWSAIWGYAMGRAEADREVPRRYRVLRAWALAVVLHGLFNMMLINFPPGALGMLALVPLTWWLVHRRIVRARDIRDGVSSAGG
jgi:RsiW-degrading membrane proteinase PrsW (M82 family)